jgi:hypothetical protein
MLRNDETSLSHLARWFRNGVHAYSPALRFSNEFRVSRGIPSLRKLYGEEPELKRMFK